MQALSNLIYNIKMSGYTVDHRKHIDDDICIGAWEAFWDIDFRFTNNIKMPLFAQAHRITDPTLIVLPVRRSKTQMPRTPTPNLSDSA